jgi:hypothetical protein
MSMKSFFFIACSCLSIIASSTKSTGLGYSVSGRVPSRNAAPAPPVPRSRDYGNTPIWPLPANAAPASYATLDPTNFSFVLSPPDDQILAQMTSRARDVILYHPNGTAAPDRTPLTVLFVVVSDDAVRQIQEGVDESYEIACSLDGTSATISASTIFGARHAVESFSQMVSADRLTGEYSVGCLNISEGPRFSHRGLLIDSSRHWLNPNLLLSIMDGMSFNKMNALQVCAVKRYGAVCPA